ncbi:MAG: hypothetical protein LBC90_02470 [Candidatus Adiutrix sp.]|jgi:hypothetical protein|nr:hypothetical protein [Candidatus Adiutrix sp.]
MTADPGRHLLAPRLGPWPPPGGETPSTGPRFYLSWPGWEDYLAKRLGLKPDPAGPAPLILPADPEDLTLAALDQLADRAGRQGADLWPLLIPPTESPSSLASAIRRPTAPAAPRPLLSDRAYLALWTLTEFQAAAGAELLAEAARKERAMWAALKGEEAAPPTSAPPPSAEEEPDRRAAYAWCCWRRLAATILRPGDLIIPTVPEFLDDTGSLS